MKDEILFQVEPHESGTEATEKIRLEPYVGPRSFESWDADIFFGRERETSEILSLIIAHPVVLLYARSGAGKTSLLNTKLRPLLEDEGFEILPTVRVQWAISADIDLNDIPNIFVFNAISSCSKHLIDFERQIVLTLDSYLEGIERSPDEDGLPRPLLIIFDQFEELFTSYPHRWQDREPFFNQIGNLLEKNSRLRVLFAMREDHIAHLDPYVSLLPENISTRYHLERLRRTAALSAIVSPLEVLREKTKSLEHDVLIPSYKPGVPEKLVANLMAIKVETETGQTETKIGEFVEPVQLQIVCQNLWQNLPIGIDEISENHLEIFGNVDQALSNFYEMSIRVSIEQSGFDEFALREFIGHDLITPAGTRGIVYKNEQKGVTGSIPNNVIEILENLHLIRMEWRSGSPWYELIHDRFIQPIYHSNQIFKQAYHETQLTKLIRSMPLRNPRPLPPSKKEARTELKYLLNNLRITMMGDSDHPEHTISQIPLLKTMHMEKVDNHFAQALELSSSSDEAGATDREIGIIFNEVNRLLLILGAPGSGKTTTLYELAQDLLDRVEQDFDKILDSFTHPIPVFIHLSTWTNKWKSLKDWLVDELLRLYKVPHNLGESWIINRHLIPLLDGLDEVEPKSRVRCVELINDFVEEIGPPGVVVSSRIAEYENLPIRLKFYGAIILEPLADDQISHYFSSIEDESIRLKFENEEYENFRKIAQSPLMLNILFTNQTITASMLPDEIIENHVTYLLNSMQDMREPFSENQVRSGLSWLAEKMEQHHLVAFSPDLLQPSWLSSRIWRMVYLIGSRLVGWLLVGLLIGGITGGLSQVGLSFDLSGLFAISVMGSVVGLVFGAVVGGIIGLIDLIRFELLGKNPKVDKGTGSITQIFANLVGLSIAFCIAIGLVYGLSQLTISSVRGIDLVLEILIGLVIGVPFGPILALPFGLVTGLRGSRQRLVNDIQVVEALDWSLRKTLWSASPWLIGFGLVGLTMGLFNALDVVILMEELWPVIAELASNGLRGAMIGGLSGAFVFGIIKSAGLRRKIVELSQDPNQGLRLMVRNAFFGGLITALYYSVTVGMLVWVIWPIIGDPVERLMVGLRAGLMTGSAAGIFALFWYGWFDLIQHAILNFILKLHGNIPNSYVRFLNQAAELNLLKKVDGRFIFSNRAIKEYFASQDERVVGPRPGKIFSNKLLAWKSCLWFLVPGIVICCCLVGSIIAISYAIWSLSDSMALVSPEISEQYQPVNQAERLLDDGEKLASNGYIEEARDKFEEAQMIDPSFEVPANSWNSLCWYGSIWGYPADVTDACENAVALATEEAHDLGRDVGNLAGYRDSRGVNRALLGDISGAIDDFEYFVIFYQFTDSYEDLVDKRQSWIQALQSGNNPFDEATLYGLRSE